MQCKVMWQTEALCKKSPSEDMLSWLLLGMIVASRDSHIFIRGAREIIHLVMSVRLSETLSPKTFTITSPKTLSVSVINCCFDWLHVRGRSFFLML